MDNTYEAITNHLDAKRLDAQDVGEEALANDLGHDDGHEVVGRSIDAAHEVTHPVEEIAASVGQRHQVRRIAREHPPSFGQIAGTARIETDQVRRTEGFDVAERLGRRSVEIPHEQHDVVRRGLTDPVFSPPELGRHG